MKAFWSVILAVSVVAGTPFAQGSKKDDLFPTGQGSSWEFTGTAGPTPIKMTALITSTKSDPGKKTVTMQWTMNDKVSQIEEYVVTSAQVARAKSGQSGANELSP